MIGSIISFNLDYWDGNGHKLKLTTSTVLGIISDPLGRREEKYKVKVGNQYYGIPFSEVISITPTNGTQLDLFKTLNSL